MTGLLGRPIDEARRLLPDGPVGGGDLGLGVTQLQAGRDATRVDLLVHEGRVVQTERHGEPAEDPELWPALIAHRDALLGAPPLLQADRVQAIRALLRCLDPVARVSAAAYLHGRRPLEDEDVRAIEVLLADPVLFGVAEGGCIMGRGTAHEVLEPQLPCAQATSGHRRRGWWRGG